MSSTSNNNQHAAMRLHNELQRQRRVGALTYDDRSSGLEHQLVWTSTVYIDGNPCGTGTASSKQDARDEAAAQALETLNAGN